MNRYKKSIELTRLARMVTPGGVQTLSKRAERFPEGAFPAYLEEGEGARVWDVDGNNYVDYICGLGAVSLGYTNDDIMDAAVNWASMPTSSLGTPLEEEVASMLVNMIPCAEMVRFTKTGSEACTAAVRIAQRYTKRACLISIGYHGWHHWAVEGPGPGCGGGQYTFFCPYNDLDQLEELLRRPAINGGVAAVIIEPVLFDPPQEGYLQGVIDLCERYGALCIFDEMVTGFRWSLTGASGYFGVTPHMAVYGKALANGFPLACVVGSRKVMKYADVISGTYGGECVSLAAAKAALPQHPEAVTRQWERGSEFWSYCVNLGIPIDGYPVHPRIGYKGKKMALFLQETARRGILLHPGGFNMSAALTEEDMWVTRKALRGAVEAMGKGVKLKGKLPKSNNLRKIIGEQKTAG